MRKIFVILTLCLVCLTGCQVQNEIVKTENPINVEQLNAEIVEELEENSSKTDWEFSLPSGNSYTFKMEGEQASNNAVELEEGVNFIFTYARHEARHYNQLLDDVMRLFLADCTKELHGENLEVTYIKTEKSEDVWRVAALCENKIIYADYFNLEGYPVLLLAESDDLDGIEKIIKIVESAYASVQPKM